MMNYEVDPGVLQGFVPAGTELECWHGKHFLSLVGFRFLKTRVLGIGVPFHCNFDEVNLRIYVQRRNGGEFRQGVAFIREIAPRRAIATVARVFYNEQYVSLPMSHRVELRTDGGAEVEYRWRTQAGWNAISLSANGEPQLPAEGSEEQFIAEHYWGYSRQRDGGSVEYRVDHPSWRVWRGRDARFEGNVEDLYGHDLAQALTRRPSSAFLAEGSAVTVYHGSRIAT